MGSDSALQRFSEAVAARLSGSRVGALDWSQILAIVIPIVLDCFKSSDEMRSCCADPTAMQKIGLNIRLRRALRRSTVRPFQIQSAANDVGAALLAEAKVQATSQLAAGEDPFADAFAEAQRLSGA